MGQQRAGIVAGLVAYTVWGMLTVYWKQLEHFSAFELIGWRITASAAVMVVVLTTGKRWAHVARVWRDRRLLLRVSAAAVALTVNWTSYVWAVVHHHVLETALGYFIAPLGTVMVGVIVLKEPLRAAQGVALGLGAAAVAVLTVSYGRVPWLALSLAVSWTVYGYLKKHVPLTPVESMAAESFVLLLPAFAVAAAFAGRAGSIPHAATGRELLFACLSGVATVAPLTLFAFAAQRVPLSTIGPMQYVVPTMNFLIGWRLYDERLTTQRVIGFGLVWVGLVVLTLDMLRRTRAQRASDLQLAGVA
jgi:chloramphenicol-sensitive protein RarD